MRVGHARTASHPGRIAILVLVVAASLALATGVRAQDAGGEPSDLTAMKTAKVDLQAALSYERMTLASAKDRDSAKAHNQLVNARGALNDGEDAIKQLTPPLGWTMEF